MLPSGCGKAGDWAFYDNGNELSGGEIAQVNDATYRLVDGQKIPRRRAWLVFPKGNSEYLEKSADLAATLDVDKLWQTAAGDTLSAEALAKRVLAKADFDDIGRRILSAESVSPETAFSILQLAIVRAALASPFYFRRAAGQFTPALPQAVAGALQSRDTKAKLLAEEEDLVQTLRAGKTPAAIAKNYAGLLSGKDKNTPAYRALKKITGSSPEKMARFFIARGVLADARDYWGALFRREWPHPEVVEEQPPDLPVLPPAPAAAFSIDDADTIEVDDAFSVALSDDGHWRVGVHIAVPALAFPFGDDGDVSAKKRMLSVYFPDEKHPMLPQSYLAAYSLKKGEARAALSQYFLFDTIRGVMEEESCSLENVFLSDQITPAQVEGGKMDDNIAAAYGKLKCLAATLPESPVLRDKQFTITANPPSVIFSKRTTVSLTVEALMRLANGVWAAKILGHGGLFRSNGLITVAPEANEIPYAWFTSPLRRYVDLINQRLLLSLLFDKKPAAEKWSQLADAFNERHIKARHYQKIMERHFSMLALRRDISLAGITQKDGRVRLNDYPLSGELASRPPKAHLSVNVQVSEIDLVAQRLRFQVL